MSQKNKNAMPVLTMGFTAGALFDMKDSENVFDKSGKLERETLYRNYFAEMNKKNEILKPGPALGLYIALNRLKQILPKDLIEIKLGLTSRFDSSHAGVTTLYSSLEHYMLKDGNDYMPDYLSLTGGLEQASPHKMQGADVVFTTSDTSAIEYHKNGVASVHIQNISEEQNILTFNNRNNPINFIFDFDGVVGDHNSEMVYQAAKKIGNIDPVEAFRLFELKNKDLPQPLGPLGVFLKKASVIVAYYQKEMLENRIEPDQIPFETRIMTARGGSATCRVIKTLAHNGIQVTRTDFLCGRPKHIPLAMLNEKNINLFLEDSLVHIDGVREKVPYVMAGLVVNDLTSGDDNLEKVISELMKENEGNEIKE